MGTKLSLSWVSITHEGYHCNSLLQVSGEQLNALAESSPLTKTKWLGLILASQSSRKELQPFYLSVKNYWQVKIIGFTYSVLSWRDLRVVNSARVINSVNFKIFPPELVWSPWSFIEPSEIADLCIRISPLFTLLLLAVNLYSNLPNCHIFRLSMTTIPYSHLMKSCCERRSLSIYNSSLNNKYLVITWGIVHKSPYTTVLFYHPQGWLF